MSMNSEWLDDGGLLTFCPYYEGAGDCRIRVFTYPCNSSSDCLRELVAEIGLENGGKVVVYGVPGDKVYALKVEPRAYPEVIKREVVCKQ